jgi:hypothetical protein
VAKYAGNSTLDQISVRVSVKATDVLWFSPYFLGDTFIETETLYMVRQG